MTALKHSAIGVLKESTAEMATSSVEGNYYKAEGAHQLNCQVSELLVKPKGDQVSGRKRLIGEGFSTAHMLPESSVYIFISSNDVN